MIRWVLACLLLLAIPTLGHAQTARPPKKAAGRSSVVQQTWVIDTTESKLTFDLRHLLSRAGGRFETWSGTVTFPGNDWNKAAVAVTIKTASINTDNPNRDKHLRGSDFFDAEHHPEITFKSTRVQRHGDSITVAGNLTIKGVTKPVVLKGKFLGTTAGPNPRMHFQATTTVNRMDYGVSYNRMVEAGGTLLGDDVTMVADVVLMPT